MPQQLNQHPIDFGVVAHGFHDDEAGQTHREDGTVLGDRLGVSAANGRNISGAGMASAQLEPTAWEHRRKNTGRSTSKGPGDSCGMLSFAGFAQRAVETLRMTGFNKNLK